MEKRNILAIGASAGGIDALRKLFAAMPRDVSATVFVVQHISRTQSVLPTLLTRAGWLPVFHPQDGEAVRPGWIHVAPPDHHLLVCDGRALVRRGPRENRTRPAIDPLFRSAAAAYGPRVIGVVLTGMQDAGTAGLRAVTRCGGLAVVQDPEDAEWPDMPRHALENAEVDHCVPLAAMPALLTRLIGEPAGPAVAVPEDIAVEASIPEKTLDTVPEDTDSVGRPSPLSCPDCGGNLSEITDGPPLRFRCKIGHTYNPEALADAHKDAVERALWVALRTHEDRVVLFDRLTERAREHGHKRGAENWASLAREARQSVDLLRTVLTGGGAPSQRAGRQQSDGLVG